MGMSMAELPDRDPAAAVLRPRYLKVFLTFARNSLVRDMTFRLNFILQCLTSISWTVMNIGFYIIVFQFTKQIGVDTGWGKYQFFIFLATTWLINSLVQAFFMPNAQEFSELIRTGHLDFALVKPIDTQFLISFQKVDWSALSNFWMGIALLGFSLSHLMAVPDPLVLHPVVFLLYPIYIVCGCLIMYSVMITLAATSIWLGRNQTLYNFWFYLTNFSRYPMEIYWRSWGWSLWGVFTFLIPVLVVVNVPARLMAQPISPRTNWELWLTGFAVLATVMSLWISRAIFRRALMSYRSASS
jgi:ABC-2 type transport system permease protein|tara:strand:- start:2178 stop:3074 length:897 start_codon:yes stop_codon:yes gene_type:complete